MAALSTAAEHLLAWLSIYKLTPAQYNSQLTAHPKAQRRGAFVGAFAELLDYYGS